ncbi:PREDICTED: uncharacterized protein LOC105313296 [Amphimedon queenslandica]|uniref:Uncharacterized protein n=1 Tax=Amphimedon queenslandica TaxID=400682 RepID=A0AAN0JAV8_AMPQE|nr:PREDICTED: uncharacterized protein LOC105313296 [Amphimedon queenslandica]|eukprot:XP_019853871.1 PREDICTED: uncharacterized protein LOC105313296 [Amphimedon queenslandica]
MLPWQPSNNGTGIMFGVDFFKTSDGEESESEDGERFKSPPRTRTEWVESQGMGSWPQVRGFEEILDRNSLLGRQEGIEEDLRTHAPWKSGMLNEINGKLAGLEDKLKELSERFLYAENIRNSVSDETGGIRIIKDNVDPRSYCNPDLLNAIKSSTGDKSASNDALLTTFQSATTENELPQDKSISQAPSNESNRTTDESTTAGASSSIMTNHVSSPLKTNASVNRSMTVNTSHNMANFEGQLELRDTACEQDVAPTTNENVMITVDISRAVDSSEIKTEPVKFVENDAKSPLSKEISAHEEDDPMPPPLPNRLESLPLLDAVSRCQGFPAKFMKPWKKFFCCESSSTMLHCAFWWIWLKINKPDQAKQDHLYTIMAEQFSQLFLLYSTSEIKDKLFQSYPSCLSQGVFAIFCQAFPKSVKKFHEESFLHKICNFIYEWTTGIPCPLGCWKCWTMEALDPSYKLHMLKKPTKKQPHQPLQIGGTAKGVQAPSRKHEERPKEEAAMIGPGPEFECVQFITSSQSPLFQHHLLMKRLKEPTGGGGGAGGDSTGATYTGLVMGRTQIKKQQPPSMTFKELLRNSKELSEKRNEAYEKQLLMYQQQVSEAVQENKVARRNIRNETQKLLKQRNEVTIEAEKIMSKYTPQYQVSSYLADVTHDD